MKLNLFQKIVLLLYGSLFIYFSFIHVPFKVKRENKIAYDTLFSQRPDLDFSRLVMIIVVITVVAGVLFLLAKNLRLNFSLKLKLKPTLYILLGISVIGISILLAKTYKTKPNNPELDTISTTRSSNVADTSRMTNDPLGILKPKNLKDKNKDVPLEVLAAFDNNPCTDTIALEKFRSHMKFYYPDWKIYGKPILKRSSECIYQIQFTTIDPHYKYLSDKEVVIVRMNLKFSNLETGTIYFKTIRGELY